jgi:hypothetical protein
VGVNDAGDPFADLIGNTPGPVGIADWAEGMSLLEESSTFIAGTLLPPSAPSADANLSVSRGQVTFDAEGNDDPNSPYFSRKIHWPGNAESGVTIGRGYDLGNRSAAEVKADFIAAGLPEKEADALSKGAGKKGNDAKTFVAENKDKIAAISHDVQKKLFEAIYPGYVSRARTNYDKWTADKDDQVAWDELSPTVRDVLVDFVYQGFTKGARPMEAGMTNDPAALIEYVTTSETMKRYEAGRRRADYLRRFSPEPVQTTIIP